MKGIRNISGKTVPIYAWQAVSATSVMRMCGPEKYGGTGDLMKKMEGIKTETEEEWFKELKKVKLIMISIVVWC